MKTKQTIAVLGALIALLWNSVASAATFTAAANGNWSLAATWGGTTTSRAGTISTSTGSTSCTGSGTAFTSVLAVGDSVYTSGGTFLGTVASITSDTALTFRANGASTVSASAWASYKPPGSGDLAIIPSAKTVTIPNADTSRTTGAINVQSGGTLTIGSGSGTVTGVVLGDVTVDSGGTLNGNTGNGQSWTFSGNVTNNGSMLSQANNSTIYTYSGTDKFLVGNITNVIASFSGTYRNLGNLVTGAGSQQVNGLQGAGALTNLGVIYYGGSTVPGIANLICTNPGNAFICLAGSGQTPGVKGVTYYNIQHGVAGGTPSFAGVPGVLYDLTIQNGGNFPGSWPASMNLGGAFIENDVDSGGTLGTAFTLTSDTTFGGNGAITLVFSSAIGGAFNVTKRGATTYTWQGNNTFGSASTATTIAGGTLNLDYTTVNSKLPDSTKLVFGGLNDGLATLNLLNGGSAHNEVVASTTINAGAAKITRSSGTSVMRLNSITRNTGGTLDIGAASIADSDTSNANGILGGYLTLASLDWGMTSAGAADTAITAYTAYSNVSLGGSIADGAISNVRINSGASGNITLGSTTTTINTLDQNLGTAATIDAATKTLRMGPIGGILLGTGKQALTIGTAAGSGTLTAGGADSTAGELVLINHSGNALTINSVIADNGSSSFPVTLTKSGTGGVTLNTANTYSGPSYINQGTLTLGASGTIANSPSITVASGATLSIPATTFGSSPAQDLAGSGTISGALATLGANGTIHPGGNGIYGTLTFGTGLTCNSGSNCKLTFDLDDPNGPYNDKIAVTGTLTCNGANIVINPSATFRTGVYTLATATSVSGTFNSGVTFTTGSGSATLSYTSTSVILTVSSYASCPTPPAYPVTGTGTFCNDSGATLGLANSDSGTVYQLFRGTTAVDVGVVSSGGATNPPAWAALTTAGTYSVWATNGCGSFALMSGTATVNPAPSSAFSVTGGDGCSSPGVTIGLSGSETGVSYQLLKDGGNSGSPVPGTGSAISFGLQTAAGVYTVQGSIAGCTTATMSGSPSSVTITATPNAPTAVAAVAGDSQVTVSWTAPGSGATPTGYNVKRSTTSGSGYSTLAAGANVGTNSFTDTTAVNGTAYYYVVSALNAACESTNSSPEAPATPNPAFSGFTITGNGSPQAGSADQLTITAVDAGGTPVTGVSGDIPLTFSGLATALDGSFSTVSDKNGVPRNLGVVTTITFVSGVGSTASSAANLIAHKAEAATLHVSDGTHSSLSTGGAGLSLSVSAGADTAYRISAATSTPVVGVTNTLTISIVDQYQNPSSFTGTKNITFGGLSAAPDGSFPTVDGVAFGTLTPINFSSPASAALISHKVEANKLLTATDGSLTAASTGGTAPTLWPTVGAAAQLGIIAQPSTAATAGIAFAQQPVIVVLDGFANVVSNSTASISASANVGTLQGTTSVNANGSNGRATFSGLSLTNAGAVTLTFASSGLTSTNSSAISVSGGAAVALVWTTQPGAAVYGSPFGTQPVLKMVDQFGNPTTSGLLDTMIVTLSISSGGGALVGTTNYNIGSAGSNGVVTFTDLRTTTAGNKQLTASLQSGIGAPPAGMAIWLRADTASSITTNGSGIVTAWADQSGNGNNFATTIGSGGNGIRYTNTVVPGRKAVTFNATSASAATELMNSTYANSSSAISVFIIAKKTFSGTGEGATQRSCASLSTSSGTHDYFTIGSFEIDYGTDNKTPRFFRNNQGGGLSGGAFDPATAYHADEFIANASSNSFWLTTSSLTTAGTTTIQVGSFSINRFSVGGGLDTGGVINNPFAGDICELLVYTSDMTSQRAAIESYLKAKWLASTPTLVASATFNVATVTLTPVVTVNDKTYNGDAIATIATRNLIGVVGGDDVNLGTSGTALFSDKNIGTNKPVTITGLSLSGTTATNYLLSTSSTNASASIATRTLTVTASGSDKFYDGTTNATVALSDDRVLGDDLTVTYSTAGFEDAAPGTNKPVHVVGIAITGGADLPNYFLGNSNADTTASIISTIATAVLTPSSNPSAHGQNVSFVAVVSSQSGTPTGDVRFSANGIPFGTNAVVSGVATNAGLTNLPRGTNTITAEFAGSGSFTGFTGTDLLLQIVTNNSPQAGTAYYTRPSGISLKIKISDLLTNATDADQDVLSLVGVSSTTTNGSPLTTDSTYIFVETNNVDDAFSYTVQDGYGGTNSGTVVVSIVATNPGQSQLVLTGGTAIVTFAGIPGRSYTAERATNVTFTGTLRTWTTNAPPGGVFQVIDDFSDLGGPPSSAFYWLRYNP